ncbi:MAG TPA: hypothetical protein VGZ22_14605 [Isosphaeraceae bacterium]|jgi:hypothetical protein|nr:hypothetical protein [Isosphaeraceae bacterium]
MLLAKRIQSTERVRQQLIGAGILVFGLIGWFLWVVVRPHFIAAAYFDMSRGVVDWQLNKATWTHGGSTHLDLSPARSDLRDGDLRNLSSLYWVEQLDLSDCDNITDSGLANIAGLKHLKVLSLSSNQEPRLRSFGPKITDAGLVQLRGLTALRELSLRGSLVTDAGLANLADLTNLEVLELSSTVITDAGLRHISALKRLKRLTLRQTMVTDAGLAQIAGLTNLEDLDLGSTNVSDSSVPLLSSLPRLTRLEMDHTRVTVTGWAALLSAHPTQEVFIDAELSDPIYQAPESPVYEP